MQSSREQQGEIRKPSSVTSVKKQKKTIEWKREEKEKGNKYPSNAEFQIMARRGKKTFLSEQCKEIEENNRMEKTRDIFREVETKGTFPEKMGSVKDRNSMGLTEAEEIKKRWQEYTEELYKMVLITQKATMV